MTIFATIALVALAGLGLVLFVWLWRLAFELGWPFIVGSALVTIFLIGVIGFAVTWPK